VILDLVPKLTRGLVLGRIVEADGSGTHPIRVSPAQAAVLLGVGLQLRTVTDVGAELGLPSHQVLALFQKGMAKIARALAAMEERQVAAGIDAAATSGGRAKVQCSVFFLIFFFYHLANLDRMYVTGGLLFLIIKCSHPQCGKTIFSTVQPAAR
jgi:hypothetical protein